jgi:hypothetical protein
LKRIKHLYLAFVAPFVEHGTWFGIRLEPGALNRDTGCTGWEVMEFENV